MLRGIKIVSSICNCLGVIARDWEGLGGVSFRRVFFKESYRKDKLLF